MTKFLCFGVPEIEPCYKTQAVLKLALFLPQPPECWYYRFPPLYLTTTLTFLSATKMSRKQHCFILCEKAVETTSRRKKKESFVS
jgi:hypothetical protein